MTTIPMDRISAAEVLADAVKDKAVLKRIWAAPIMWWAVGLLAAALFAWFRLPDAFWWWRYAPLVVMVIVVAVVIGLSYGRWRRGYEQEYSQEMRLRIQAQLDQEPGVVADGLAEWDLTKAARNLRLLKKKFDGLVEELKRVEGSVLYGMLYGAAEEVFLIGLDTAVDCLTALNSTRNTDPERLRNDLEEAGYKPGEPVAEEDGYVRSLLASLSAYEQARGRGDNLHEVLQAAMTSIDQTRSQLGGVRVEQARGRHADLDLAVGKLLAIGGDMTPFDQRR